MSGRRSFMANAAMSMSVPLMIGKMSTDDRQDGGLKIGG